MVVVHYGPPEAQPVTDATGPLFDVELLSFTPYRAPDPKYLKCSVVAVDWLFVAAIRCACRLWRCHAAEQFHQ